MGYGDEVLATAFAKGASARGKRIAFGDGSRILWAQTAEVVYRYNPNIASPGSERSSDLEWIKHYKHNRIYFRRNSKNTKWEYDPSFRVSPGEIYFSKEELDYVNSIPSNFVLIEPFVKPCYPNKQWAFERYQQVATKLVQSGFQVCQFIYDRPSLMTKLIPEITTLRSRNFRHGLAMLSKAKLLISAEGGLVHGAAALGVPSVVLFGGFTDPKILGYSTNRNLTGGAESCGSLIACRHCREAMNKISVEEVYQNALELLR